MVGFTDLGHRHNPHEEEVGPHALIVHSKSFSGTPGLKYPVAYFSTSSIAAGQLSSVMWECVTMWECACEKQGIKVSVIVARITL